METSIEDGLISCRSPGSPSRSSSSSGEKTRDELRRADGLRLVAGVLQHVEMCILSDDPFRTGGDGAVGKRIIVRVGGDGAATGTRA